MRRRVCPSLGARERARKMCAYPSAPLHMPTGPETQPKQVLPKTGERFSAEEHPGETGLRAKLIVC
ncbi:hypothetical protein Ethha_0304 [Ethanoligenens harbinense YUAN-3]|uniref:Uncharacterized protein n=1 Tax=Ethanoligenens harbinense (strain DSM 18485 / JCM 12961 / CGMCC 1.5033 / YUAN-3) TaxID=663278 RepID=E6U7V8_ETHHY|nr:hypothetical protein Ethha_0304 [Ethanoligenens harbinense YUAN-3]